MRYISPISSHVLISPMLLAFVLHVDYAFPAVDLYDCAFLALTHHDQITQRKITKNLFSLPNSNKSLPPKNPTRRRRCRGTFAKRIVW